MKKIINWLKVPASNGEIIICILAVWIILLLSSCCPIQHIENEIDKQVLQEMMR